jgi:DNA-binding LacI/PurR family transcriptional regulator
MHTKREHLYSKISKELAEAITSGQLPPGNALPSQNELAKIYGVSTMTSRRALSELEKWGLIVRIQGKGSFVNHTSQQAQGFSNIGFVHNISDWNTNEGLFNPFYVQALQGVIERAKDYGLSVACQVISGRSDKIEIWDDTAWVLLDTNLSIVEKLKALNKPIVSIHSYYPDLDIPFVVSDDVAGGYEVTSHLIGLGHRRIGVLLPENLMQISKEFSNRYQGYVIALKQHHIELDASLIKENVEVSIYGGYVVALDMLTQKEPPTAIFALTDMQALGVLQAARELGIRVPEELSVAGYDDQLFAQVVQPALTTVKRDAVAIGRQAVDVLIKEVGAKERHNLMVNLKPELVVRQSTAEVHIKDREGDHACVVI